MFRIEGECAMQRVNEYRFYELGQRIRAIHGIDGETLYSDSFWNLWQAREALVALKSDVVALRISLQVVERVIAAITNIVPTEFAAAIAKYQEAQGSPATPVGFGYHELQRSLEAFEPVLAAECNALDTYVVSQKRGYSTPDLVDRSEIMLPIETQVVIGDSVTADIRSAGRCLAFDTPTAAGFHVLRAVEAVMAEYYKHLTGKNLPKQNRNWGLYLKRLEKVLKADPKIHGALDHIRDNYRNPISHPEVTLKEGEAIMLFGLSLSVIELMAEAIRSTTPALTEAEQLAALSEIAAKSSEPEDDF